MVKSKVLELQILAQALNKREHLDAVVFGLDREDFQDPMARSVYDMVKKAYSKNIYMDFGMAFNEASDAKVIAYLSEVGSEYISLEYPIQTRIATLKNTSAVRYANEQVNALKAEFDAGKISDPKEVVSQLSSLAKSIIVRSPDPSSKPLSQLITDALNDAMKNNTDRIECGIDSLDKLTGGLRKGDYVVIAARTGIGKSALCLDFHLRCGLSKRWSMYCSTEMTSVEVILRSVAKMSGVPLNTIHSEPQYIGNDDMTKIAQAKQVLERGSMLFYDNLRTANAIENEYFKQKQRGNHIRLIVIDYIQQLRADGKRSSRQEELADMSNRLMQLAVEEQITVIVCAQLNRTSDPYEEPKLSQIKDCGSIEQDATVVIALNRERADPTRQITNAHVLKIRNGQPDSTRLKFYGSTMRFYGA